jgi:hypothetical protein
VWVRVRVFSLPSPSRTHPHLHTLTLTPHPHIDDCYSVLHRKTSRSSRQFNIKPKYVSDLAKNESTLSFQHTIVFAKRKYRHLSTFRSFFSDFELIYDDD